MMKKLIFLLFMVIVTGACIMQRNRITYKCDATLFLVYDNYPKGYKKTMGDLSYTRNVLLVFSIKNLSDNVITLPISNNNEKDTTLMVRVKGKKSAFFPCISYGKHCQNISFGDSTTIAIHLRPSDLEEIGINIDEKPIEDFIPVLHFECLQKENGKTIPIITEKQFKLSPNILYKHGKMFIEYCNDGIKKEKEIYEDSSDYEIVKRYSLIEENYEKSRDQF